MDEKRTDWKAVLREIASGGGNAGPHVGVKRLISYSQGTLPAQESEAVQDHLSHCARCTGLLRELRDFEKASSGDVVEGPEPLREEAWASLVRRLPPKTRVVRPIPTALPPPARPRQIPRLVYALAAGLLLAAVGLSLWTSLLTRQERQRLASLAQRLEEREEALSATQRSLAEAQRQLAAARGQIRNLEKERTVPKGDGEAEARVDELEARVAELTSALERLRRAPQPDRLAAASPVELSVAPRFALRGQEPPELLREGGAVNRVRSPPQGGRVTLALSLADHAVLDEYRLELVDGKGKVLWTGRRPGTSLLGDAGTWVSISGLSPGSYRLRIEGLSPDRTELLGEYILELGPEEPA